MERQCGRIADWDVVGAGWQFVCHPKVLEPVGVYSLAGQLKGTIGNSSLNSPLGEAFDAAGYLYAADYNNNRIVKFDTRTGGISQVFGGTGSRGRSWGR